MSSGNLYLEPTGPADDVSLAPAFGSTCTKTHSWHRAGRNQYRSCQCEHIPRGYKRMKSLGARRGEVPGAMVVLTSSPQSSEIRVLSARYPAFQNSRRRMNPTCQWKGVRGQCWKLNGTEALDVECYACGYTLDDQTGRDRNHTQTHLAAIRHCAARKGDVRPGILLLDQNRRTAYCSPNKAPEKSRAGNLRGHGISNKTHAANTNLQARPTMG